MKYEADEEGGAALGVVGGVLFADALFGWSVDMLDCRGDEMLDEWMVFLTVMALSILSRLSWRRWARLASGTRGVLVGFEGGETEAGVGAAAVAEEEDDEAKEEEFENMVSYVIGVFIGGEFA